MTDIIGVIPARGGSKDIPGKNIKELAGKPLIAWTIEAALGSTELNRVIVSTDDNNIVHIAKEWGAEVPFIRPENLASDTATSFAVVKHAMGWLEKEEGISPEYVMLLQPTSPLRTTEDIRGVIRLREKRNAASVVSVCETINHPYHIKKIKDDGTLENFIKNTPKFSRRQELPQAFTLNGAVYLNKWETLKQEKKFISGGTLAYIMPQERSIDIDTSWDFFLAEQILREKISKQSKF
jgi:CMP-N-acetylneuraminic acid synthetase